MVTKRFLIYSPQHPGDKGKKAIIIIFFFYFPKWHSQGSEPQGHRAGEWPELEAGSSTFSPYCQ